MSQTPTPNVYRPKLKIELPTDIERLCPQCGQHSMAVVMDGPFRWKCQDPGCAGRLAYEPQDCLFLHRQHALGRMSIDRSEVVVLEQIEGEPDAPAFEFIPEVEEGPYSKCAGHLKWDVAVGVRLDTWLVCDKCEGAFHVMIYSAASGTGPGQLYFSQFRIKTTPAGKTVVSEWKDGEAGIASFGQNLRDMLGMTVLEARWRDEEIREVETFAGDTIIGDKFIS